MKPSDLLKRNHDGLKRLIRTEEEKVFKPSPPLKLRPSDRALLRVAAGFIQSHAKTESHRVLAARVLKLSAFKPYVIEQRVNRVLRELGALSGKPVTSSEVRNAYRTLYKKDLDPAYLKRIRKARGIPLKPLPRGRPTK